MKNITTDVLIIGGAGSGLSLAIFLNRLGRLYIKTNQTAQAVDTFRQIAAIDPTAGPTVAGAIIEAYRGAKDLAKARAEADSALNKFPKDIGVIAEPRQNI